MDQHVANASELELLKARRSAAREERQLLKERRRAAKAGIVAESFSIAGTEFVSPLDYLPTGYSFQPPAGFGVGGVALRSNLFDREYGDNRPFVRNENDHAWVRGLARFVTTTNCAGVGILDSLANYIVGTGAKVTVKSKKHSKIPDGLVPAVQDFLDEFIDENDLKCGMDRELHKRDHCDGEFFYAVFVRNQAKVVGRVIEPDSIRDPGSAPWDSEELWNSFRTRCDYPTEWTYGIHVDAHDILHVHGYAVQWNSDEGFDYLPRRLVTHSKMNVPCTVKRGMSDFYPGWQFLQQATRLLKNTGEGAAEAAAIAYIVEHIAATENDVRSMLSNNANVSYQRTTPNGGIEQHNKRVHDPGTVLRVPNGQTYKEGPMASDRGNAFLAVVGGILRHCATRWAMTEGMVTGDDSNNNMASQLEAGSRFHKYCESDQGRFSRKLKEIYWKAIALACQLGYFRRFGLSIEELYRVLIIDVTLPELAVTKALEQEQIREIRFNAGILSGKTWSDEAGYDYDIEQQQGAKAGSGDAGPPGSDSPDGGGPGLPPKPGPPKQPGQAAASGAVKVPPPGGKTPDAKEGSAQPADGQAPEAPAAPKTGEYADKSRLQWQRNVKAINDVLTQVSGGTMRPVMGEELLQSLGLPTDRAQRLIADIQDDGKLSPENAKDLAEEIAIQILGRWVIEESDRSAKKNGLAEDCGTGSGGFKAGNTCGKGEGATGAAQPSAREKPDKPRTNFGGLKRHAAPAEGAAWIKEWSHINSPEIHTASEAWVNGERNTPEAKQLESLYADTQKGLASAGIKQMKLYRGIALPTSHPLAKDLAKSTVGEDKPVLKLGDEVEIGGAPIASWTTSKAEAKAFAASHRGKVGVVLERIADAKDIVSASGIHSGFKFPNEKEVVAKQHGTGKFKLADSTLAVY